MSRWRSVRQAPWASAATAAAFALSGCTGQVSGGAAPGSSPATGGGNSASSSGATNTAAGATATSSSGSGVTGITRVARLTHTQYDKTVKDLFGIEETPASAFAPDALNGFDFDTSLDYTVDARLGPQYRAAAEELSELAVSDNSVFNRVVPCDAGAAGCSEQFIEDFGQRAFRRPLTAAEQARFAGLFERGPELVGSGNAFSDGVRLVVEAMLQSPQFLYRTELVNIVGADGLIAPNPWEMATRLSYFLLDSMPDSQLFAEAQEGGLQTPEQIESATLRLLSEPGATEKLVSFHEQAWQFDRFSRITPDAATYPEAPSDIIERVRAASTRFVQDVIETGGGLEQLLTAPYAFADADLAPLYGQSQAGSGLSRIDFAPGERKGFLMQVGFLASNAYAIKTDPIHRGLFVLRELLCRNIPDPPPGASTTEPPAGPTPETTREEVSLLTGQPACTGCHTEINAPGFAFEGFDAVGQARSAENGVPVDTTGSMSLDGASIQFNNAIDLVDSLALSAEARSCYAGKWLEFALGRSLNEQDEGARASLAQQDRSVAELVEAIAQTPAFTRRAPNEVAP